MGKFYLASNGSLHTIKCRICNEVEGKDKLLVKWDSFCKNASRRKAKRNIGTNVKKGDLYHSKDCMHAKNHKLLAFCNHGSVATQFANGMVGKNQRKVVQFAIILHLSQ
jgi:hypothetical protein